jgi:hypothetical protein
MEFLHAAIALLSSMILVLAGMVGWLYWQQTRLFQNMNNIVMALGELAARPTIIESKVEAEPVTVPEPTEEVVLDHEEDDRVSVEEETEIVDGAPEPVDTDNLDSKTTKELKDMLTKRGIPFGKRDSKNILISLLKASA